MTQKQKLLDLLFDRKPHSNFEIHEKTGMIRYAARISELKQKGYQIESFQDKEDHRKHWYQLVPQERQLSLF